MLVAASSKAGVTEREAFYDILTRLSDPSQKLVFLKKIKNIPAGVATTQSTSASPSYREGMSSKLQRGAQAQLPALADDTATQWLCNPNRREYANLRLKILHSK